ncbi:peptidase M4 [Sphingopyxis sp. BSNA05]|uniref:PepSY domain-containing protein n=1 Tax=Sphingopyxis sp. BSNA05 TaxID=1236614 RepID=UPI0015657048|nr:PepSY domain-containing protein [Sphingopyxis sp. BSNA05]NRD89547.1 peptidase M4 [Sphingopyxis sp. BSNA05]|tara:strand:- start:3288 stop:3659 length:372 start_codon:yes stop_codon:yes gene_type:complete
MTRKSKIIAAMTFLGIAGAGAGVAFVVPAIAGEAQAGDAALSEQEAQRFAVRAAPGEVIDSELESEDGVMVYEFEIQQGDVVREIEVDAHTGAILENAIDNGDADEGEDAEDADGEAAEINQN